MKAMRVAKGQVVGNTIVLDREIEPTGPAEGSKVTVYFEEDGWEVDDAMWKELEASMAEADAGEVVSAEEALRELWALK